MTGIDPQLLEQLSAWMDGELPADEARFLQRRLANDVPLREQWERWQVASACLQHVPVRAMDPGLAERIAVAIAAPAIDDPSTAPSRSRAGWFASAAAVVLAAVMLPGILAVDPGGVAAGGPAAPVASAPTPAEPALSPTPDVLAQAVPPMSPLPSVRDFPLAVRGGQAWPRSLLQADARARDGLLVRVDTRDAAASAGPSLPATRADEPDPRTVDRPDAE